jgi:5'-nucleotidase
MAVASKRPTVLVSNDDGIDAPGIYALVKELKRFSEVVVVAPDKQRSAVGHAITMNYPLRAIPFRKNGKFFGYATDGTPADAVKLGVRCLLKSPPDMVVSGINHGSNTAINIIYSGTVSAATEGTILGIPSIAVSLTTYDEPDFTYAAEFTARLVQLVARRGLPEGTLLNVNVPPVRATEIAGVVLTRQGKSTWNDTFDVRRDPANREYFWLTGRMNLVDTSPDVDEVAVRRNLVSVTPIHYDLTDLKAMDAMNSWGVDALK